jgi:hypothetical protein
MKFFVKDFCIICPFEKIGIPGKLKRKIFGKYPIQGKYQRKVQEGGQVAGGEWKEIDSAIRWDG